MVITGLDIIRKEKIEELKGKLVHIDSDLIIQKNEIENYITSLRDSEIRDILDYYFLRDMNWIQVQLALGYEHEDTPRKKVERFLKKV